MGQKQYDFNPFTGNFDEISVDIIVVATAPSLGIEGVFYQVSGDPTKTYYFSGNNRYRIDATLDNPISNGPWLSLGVSNF